MLTKAQVDKLVVTMVSELCRYRDDPITLSHEIELWMTTWHHLDLSEMVSSGEVDVIHTSLKQYRAIMCPKQ
jgi:hypothetical protein